MTLEEVQAVLDEIRPALQGDGGDIEIVELTADNVLKARLQGACRGCPYSQMTIKEGVEAYMKDRLPDLRAVEAV